MPTEFVKKQLLSLVYAEPEFYDKASNSYYIPKYTGPTYKNNHCYIVKLDDKIFTDLPMFYSWGNSSVPHSRYLKIVVNQRISTMIKVDALEYDYEHNVNLNTMWFGWLDFKYLEQLSEI